MTSKPFIIALAIIGMFRTVPAIAVDTMPVSECVDLIQEVDKQGGRGAIFDRYADLLAQQGKYDEALRAYQRALLDGGIDGILTTEKLALLQEQLGKTDESIVFWKHLIGLKPDHSAAEDRLARLYIQRTSYQQALPILQKLHEKHPDEVCYGVMLGRAYLHERLIEPAETAFLAAYKLDPTDREIVINLGALYRYRGKHDEAAKVYKDYLVFDDSDREMRRLFVAQQVKLKKVDTDTVAMLELEARDEPTAANLYRLAVAYKLLGSEELFVQTMEKALTVDPAHAKTLTLLGRHYFQKADYKKAKEYFSRISQDDTDGDDADEYLRRIRLLTTPLPKDSLAAKKKASSKKKKGKSSAGKTGQKHKAESVGKGAKR